LTASKATVTAAEELGDFPVFLSRTQTLFSAHRFHQAEKKDEKSSGSKNNHRDKKRKSLSPQTITVTTQRTIEDEKQTATVLRMKFTSRKTFAIVRSDWSWEIS